MPTARTKAADDRAPIHPTNAWNPTGQPLLPVPGCRLYYVHRATVGGLRTQVFLGSQQHLTFVADFEGNVPFEALRARVIAERGVYPHLLDIDLKPGSHQKGEVERW